jgi:hypothetical protein
MVEERNESHLLRLDIRLGQLADNWSGCGTAYE